MKTQVGQQADMETQVAQVVGPTLGPRRLGVGRRPTPPTLRRHRAAIGKLPLPTYMN